MILCYQKECLSTKLETKLGIKIINRCSLFFSKKKLHTKGKEVNTKESLLSLKGNLVISLHSMAVI